MPRMLISSRWLQIAVLTFLIGFLILGLSARIIYTQRPPIPARVIDSTGAVLFTGDDIMAGQHLFQRRGLMQFGTLFGHGAYLGPDFTAQYLHEAAHGAVAAYQAQGITPGEASARVLAEFKHDGYDAATGVLTLAPSPATAFPQMQAFYTHWFGPPETQQGLRRPYLTDPAEVHQLTAYFAWAAWVASATRPGTYYSFTNNWPPEPLVGNTLTTTAILASMFSLIALLGGIGLIFFIVGRYDVLGWHRADGETSGRRLRFRPPDEVQLSPAQRATAWYFLVVAGLFLAQGLLGGANAHYHAEPGGFYGFNLSSLLPYNLSRMWHVQLALFFVSAAYLAMGIFLAPMIAKREPKHQEKLAIALFAAVVLVVVGSLIGEAFSVLGRMGAGSPWFWIGAQGWEYLDLGRLWQMLLVAGMLIWVGILFRGLRSRLPEEHPGNLPYLFLYSALSIPVFYAAGLLFGKMTNFTVMDFWRFWSSTSGSKIFSNSLPPSWSRISSCSSASCGRGLPCWWSTWTSSSTRSAAWSAPCITSTSTAPRPGTWRWARFSLRWKSFR